MLTTTERPGGSSSPSDLPEDPASLRRALAERIRRPELRTEADQVLALEPGRVVALHGGPGSGLTRVGLALLAEVAKQAPVVAVDTRGWVSPLAAWEVGIAPERFVVVRVDGPDEWAKAMGTLLDGVRGVYAEVPTGVPEAVLRRVGMAARNRRVGLVLRPLRGRVPTGIAHLALSAEGTHWEGTGSGTGHLAERHLAITATGKGVAGMERRFEVTDDGAHPLYLVGRMAAPAVRRTAG